MTRSLLVPALSSARPAGLPRFARSLLVPALCASLLAVATAACGERPVAPTSQRPRVVLQATAEERLGWLTIAYRLRNDDARPVVFRVQPEPFVLLTPGGAEIAVGRVAVPPDGHPNVPNPKVWMRVLAPGAAIDLELVLPLPLAERLPLFERSRTPAPGLSFCLGVTHLLPDQPTAPAGGLVETIEFADDPFYCVSLNPHSAYDVPDAVLS